MIANEEILKLCAYHESGRIVFAYQCTYGCESVELSPTDSGKGNSKLNGYNDLEFIQAIFSGKPQTIITENANKANEVAKNLMKIYCAGSCAENYFENGLSADNINEMEIPGQDAKHIEQLQNFLTQQIPNHPEDYPSKIILQIFDELKKADIWKPIEILAERILKTEEKSLNRFYIEDALMMAGFKINKQIIKQGISIQEDVSKPLKPNAISEVQPAQADGALIDKALKDFLGLVKKDWTSDEMDASIKYLKLIFKKFN